MSDNGTLLSVENLSTHFFTEEGIVKAVQDVGFSIKKGRTFALVGESGCGKSVTALSIMRLVPAPQGKIVGGKIVFYRRERRERRERTKIKNSALSAGSAVNLLALSKKQMRGVRGRKIAMIFQEPMTSLNPVYTVGNQIAEAIRLHQKKPGKEAWADAVEMLRKDIKTPHLCVWNVNIVRFLKSVFPRLVCDKI